MSALAAEHLTIEFGGIKAVNDVSFAVEPGEIFAIIGPNGAGKTTLFNLLSGIYAPRGGRVVLGGDDVAGTAPYRLAQLGLSRTFQNLQIFGRMTSVENVMVGRHRHEKRNVFAHLLALPSVRRQNNDTKQQAEALLERVGLASLASHPASALPYGALKRLEIARALASEPKVLLLDEPAAGCNAVEAAELTTIIRSIARDGITVILVEHNMHMVMNLSDRIHVLANGRTLVEGRAAEVRSNPAVIEAYLDTQTAEGAAHARH
ncbi:ABC transporter ATP-binding protein [Rhodoplanes sp. Z2-YC6860]|uniref:ABC transporter ATP-binding protein n=1 Tax=Rhodoplanes sp. Z2-YC6860 TaxID=674703 RepID=UPI00078B441C|nr:ABC transporter ATP-binding protein [Rhodoplanes sp. Z2-YC6860]AMN43933.1 branched-chain amino acid transport ATP-binding protein [Rhodoplanes sp. Z2-YC6860]